MMLIRRYILEEKECRNFSSKATCYIIIYYVGIDLYHTIYLNRSPYTTFVLQMYSTYIAKHILYTYTHTPYINITNGFWENI